MSALATPPEGSNSGGEKDNNNPPTEKTNNTTPENPPESQSQSQPQPQSEEKEKEKEKEAEDPGPTETCSNETCLTLQTFCKTCLQTTRTVSSDIPPSQIESGRGWFPISITIHVTGTQQEIQSWVWKQISRLHLFYPTRDDRRDELRGEHKHPRVRICAVERVKDASEGGGDFVDFNDITSPHPGMLSVQECSWQDTAKSYIAYASPFAGGSIGGEEEQERRMARARMPWWAKTRARTAEREVLMLVDFPEEVKEGDEVFKLFLDGFGGRVEVVEVKFPGSDTTWNAHRLAWWVYTHPAQNGDPGFSAATLEEQAARRRRSRRQSESQPQQTYTQQQPQPQQQQWQWQWQPQQPQQPQQVWYQVTTPVAWVTPISVDPNYSTASAVETERIPTAREARRMLTKTPRWMKNIKFKP